MTSKESFDNLTRLMEEKNPYSISSSLKEGLTPMEKREIIDKRIEWKNNQNARICEAIKALVPNEGTPCTMILYTDRCAATVTRIISPRKIAIRLNETKCIDFYDSEYEILPEVYGDEETFTKRRNGLWVKEGQTTKDGVLLALHFQTHYIDPNF